MPKSQWRSNLSRYIFSNQWTWHTQPLCLCSNLLVWNASSFVSGSGVAKCQKMHIAIELTSTSRCIFLASQIVTQHHFPFVTTRSICCLEIVMFVDLDCVFVCCWTLHFCRRLGSQNGSCKSNVAENHPHLLNNWPDDPPVEPCPNLQPGQTNFL